MKRILLYVPIILLVLFSSFDLFGPSVPTLNNEEHAILSAVLDSMMQNQVAETIDVYDQTSTGTSATVLHLSFEHDSIDVPPSLISNYSSANRERYELDMDKLPDYVMLKDTEESGPYTGYILFTRPGISDDGLMAVVEYSSVSAPLCGIGVAALLEKQDGDWVVIWHDMMWIS